MKIAVIETGRVGGTVGRRWADSGHEVIFGVRNPSDEKVKKLLEAVGKKLVPLPWQRRLQQQALFY